MTKNKVNSDKEYFSTSELAQLLSVSRIAIFKKIKSGQIKAEKIGRNYIIPRSEFESILGRFLSENKKQNIDKAVGRVVKQYGEALRKLGKE